MKGLENQARAMGAQIVECRSDYLPTVKAVAGYSALGTGIPVANNVNIGIEIMWPIFNSFLTSHQVAEAELRRKAIDAQIEDLHQRIILQVETAFLNWQASFLRIARAERTLAASRGELPLTEKRYAAGLSDIVELEDAERDLIVGPPPADMSSGRPQIDQAVRKRRLSWCINWTGRGT